MSGIINSSYAGVPEMTSFLFAAYYIPGYLLCLLLIFRGIIQNRGKAEGLIASAVLLLLMLPLALSILPHLAVGLQKYLPSDSTSPVYSLIWVAGSALVIKKFSLSVPISAMASDVIISNINSMLFILNPAFTVIRNNLQAEKQLGYSSGGIRGRSFTGLVFESALLRTLPVRKTGNLPVDYSENINLLSKTGELIPCRLAVTGLYNPQDELIGYTAVAVDISDKISLRNEMKERILTQQALMESEDKYKKITEAMLDYVIIINERSEYIYASPSHIRLGYSPGDLLGKLAFDYVHPDDISVIMSEFARGLEENSVKIAELRFKKADGSYIELECVGSFMGNEKNSSRSILVCSRDISERKIISAALEESGKLYRQIVDFASDFIWRADTVGKMIYANPIALRVMGLEEKEVIGINYLELIHPDYREDTHGFYINQYKKRIPSTYYEFPLMNSRKEMVWMGINMQMIIDDEEGSVIWQGIGRDISERRLFMQALKESEELLRLKNLSFERDLANAQLVQRALLPGSVPDIKSLSIEYRNYSMDAVGGDYFSFTKLREGGLGVFLGDVSGHGVTAALFLALVKSTADRACRKFGQNPGEYISQLNHDLINSMHSYFLTAIYGYFSFDDKNGKVNFTFAKGGHPAPVLYSGATGEYTLLKSKGTLIGKFTDIQYEEVQINLEKGDRLYLYTDGFPETRNSSGEIIGYGEVCSIIKDSAKESLSDTVDSIVENINIYMGEESYEDDLVIIAFEII